MGIFDRIQDYTSRTHSGQSGADGVFDTKTPEGAFFDRVHRAGYALYRYEYVGDGNVFSEEEWLALEDEGSRSLYDRELVYTELYEALSTDGNQVINAIAGSGKTTTLIFKIMHDIVTGEAMCLQDVAGVGEVRMVNHMWVCTFLRSGAADLEDSLVKWQKKLGYTQTANQITFSTLDAEFKRCLNACGAQTNIGDEKTLYSLFTRAVDACNITRDGEKLTKEDYRIIQSIVTYYRGRLDDMKYRHPSCMDYGLTPTILDLLVQQYASLRRNAGVMDFDEITELLYTFLYVKPNPSLQDFVAARYNFIYVDEFQDTSQMQYAILKFYARGHLWLNRSGEYSDAGGLYTGVETLGKIVAIGDVSQCLVADTTVESRESGVVEISTLVDGSAVKCYHGVNGLVYDEVENVAKTPYAGEVATIVLEDGHTVTSTPEHLVFVLPQFYDSYWYSVVGCSEDDVWQFRAVQGYDIKFLLSEFTKVYVLKLCATNSEAESLAKAWHINNFGFPTLSHEFTKLFYDGRERMDFLERTSGEVVRYALCGGKMATVMPVTQVLPGYQMFVEGKTGRLEPVVVERVDYQQYNGYVYDLNLPCCRNFMANGVLVHNCIYSFKGSDFRILAEYFDNDFRPTHCRLSYNWRCPSNILNPVVSSIHRNTSSSNQKIVASKMGGDFRALSFTSYRAMLQQLKGEIRKDMQEGYSVAVLCRTNFDGMIPALALESEGGFDFSVSGENMTLNSPLPRKIIGVASLFTERSSPSVKTALGYLVRRGGGYQVNRLMDTCKMNNISVWQVPDNDLWYSAPDLYKTIRAIKDIFMPGDVRDKDKEMDALVYCYYYLMENTFGGTSAYAEGARAYIEVLLYLIEVNKYKTVYEFLESVEFLNDKLQGRVKRKNAHIQIATVHESKGKEWDSVYVWNDSDGVFPGSKCDLDNEEQVEEERRVHYIACTRAKQKERIFTLSAKPGKFLLEMDLTLETTKPGAVKLKKDTVDLEDVVPAEVEF